MLVSFFVVKGNYIYLAIFTKLQANSLAPPHYLSQLLPKLSIVSVHILVIDQGKIPPNVHAELQSRFQKSFFPSAITGWNSLDLDVRNSASLPLLKLN